MRFLTKGPEISRDYRAIKKWSTTRCILNCRFLLNKYSRWPFGGERGKGIEAMYNLMSAPILNFHFQYSYIKRARAHARTHACMHTYTSARRSALFFNSSNLYFDTLFRYSGVSYDRHKMRLFYLAEWLNVFHDEWNQSHFNDTLNARALVRIILPCPGIIIRHELKHEARYERQRARGERLETSPSRYRIFRILSKMRWYKWCVASEWKSLPSPVVSCSAASALWKHEDKLWLLFPAINNLPFPSRQN